MKGQLTLSIDIDILIELQKSKDLNVSKLINDYLQEYLNISTGSEEYDKPQDKLKHLELQKIKIEKELEAHQRNQRKAEEQLREKFKGKKYYSEKYKGMVDAEQYKIMHGGYPE